MDFPLPPVGEGLIEVELVRWLVRPGDAVARGQSLAEVMSDKANMEVPSPFAGTITATGAQPGTKVKVGERFLSYEPAAGSSREDTAASPLKQPITAAVATTASNTASNTSALGTALAPPKHTNGHGPLPPAAPSVRQLARKLGVDLAQVRGTGPHGRILIDDIAPLIAAKRADAKPAPAAHATDTSKLDFGVAGTRMKLIGTRRKIAEHLVASKRAIPHYSYVDECNISDLVKLRGTLRDPLAQTGVKLTYLAFFVKAVARALKEVPVCNSTYDEPASEIVLHDKYNIGVAVAAPNGLIVPVVRDADKKDVVTIAADIDRISNDAKAGKSKLDDLRGGTFTVTSVGGIGGLISTPIINHPEVGIMGVGKVVKRPVYDEHGDLKPADIVFLSFSFDHRVVDGAICAAFGNAVIRYLHAPALLLLPEKAGA